MTSDAGHAELQVVACAIASPTASNLAHQRVTEIMFTRPDLRRLFAATPNLPTELADPTFADPNQPGLADTRASLAAERTNTHPDDVRRLLAERQTLTDHAGGYAAIVEHAWQRRQTAINLEHLAHQLAQGDDITPDTIHELANTLQ